MWIDRHFFDTPEIDRTELISLTTAIAGVEAARQLEQRADSNASLTMIDRKSARLLVVDDEPINVEVVTAYLEDAGYEQIVALTDSVQALVALEQQPFDVALLDIMMPRLSGLDMLARMRASQRLQHIPAIVMTAASDRATKRRAIELGAADFLNKPFDPEELLARTENALIRKSHFDRMQSYARELEQQVEQRTAELVSSQMQLVYCLGRAAEYRDNETGMHVLRVGRFSGVIADQLGMGEIAVRQIEMAATLHDIGKLGLPDSILLKPGRLDEDEIEVMRRHALLGREIVSPTGSAPSDAASSPTQPSGFDLLRSFDSPLLKMASTIAATHHERWDGTGYPLGLRGEAIPLTGRIVAVADVYDALSSRRPYKEPFSHQQCLDMLQAGRGTHFDPLVVDAFFARLEDVRSIQARFQDGGSQT
ncbi:HD domain-containing phosphohydrolase [Planctomicrobium piriforme]|uniref:Putative two-component system response regulator n=1 Tax=Planctomicrobium piriforme TaxID=1576369 RepID=A0A1I3GS14_9PLAN|nr:HD domain-containing phosphohydrolase [Planctomicrobium piriforme]SFI26335.1 putative two-component system response regulator [Planctomicrobium piriforme]